MRSTIDRTNVGMTRPRSSTKLVSPTAGETYPPFTESRGARPISTWSLERPDGDAG
jgi:hypothetical protein